MKYLRRYNEEKDNFDIVIDIEDVFQELVDVGFKIIAGKSIYVDMFRIEIYKPGVENWDVSVEIKDCLDHLCRYAQTIGYYVRVLDTDDRAIMVDDLNVGYNYVYMIVHMAKCPVPTGPRSWIRI